MLLQEHLDVRLDLGSRLGLGSELDGMCYVLDIRVMAKLRLVWTVGGKVEAGEFAKSEQHPTDNLLLYLRIGCTCVRLRRRSN